ncbi:MAG: urease accessory protein UreF [Janthinobacterium lividum]
MTDASTNAPARGRALLAALQQADSFFPSGAMAFSWGLEPLVRDGLIGDAAALEIFVASQALSRWATFDQGILCASWQAAGCLEKWREADAWAESMTWPGAFRAGSRRLGRTLVDVHARLDAPRAQQLRAEIIAGRAPGHLAAVQGALWQSFGIAELEARAMAAHACCTGMVSAAVRLGVVGHLDAQRILTALRQPIADVLNAPAPLLTQLSSTSFAADIGSLRAATADARMFAN